MIDEQKKVNLRIFLAKKRKKVLISGEKKPFLIYTKERYFCLIINRILILNT